MRGLFLMFIDGTGAFAEIDIYVAFDNVCLNLNLFTNSVVVTLRIIIINPVSNYKL